MTLWLVCALCLLVAALTLAGSTNTATATREEQRMAEVLSAIAGAGKVEVALFYADGERTAYSEASRPTGAVVVAQGAGDMGVRLQLIRAVRTLLGLPENAVDVFVMEDGR